jgi:hypothetical protein
MRAIVLLAALVASGATSALPPVESAVLRAASLAESSPGRPATVVLTSQRFCEPSDYDAWTGYPCVYPQSLGQWLLDAGVSDIPAALQPRLVEMNRVSRSLADVDFSPNATIQLELFEKLSLEEIESERTASPARFGYVLLSMPAVSDDGLDAVVYRALVCGGNCGEAHILHLRLIDGQWTIKHVRRLYVA